MFSGYSFRSLDASIFLAILPTEQSLFLANLPGDESSASVGSFHHFILWLP
jgi:hypothetical protein